MTTTSSPTFTALTLLGAEAGDAVLTLDADEGDDATDTWLIKSLATGNSLSFLNDVTEVANLTSAGALQLDSLAGGGTLCVQTDNNGLISAAAAACGSGSSSLQGAYDTATIGLIETDATNPILFTETTGGGGAHAADLLQLTVNQATGASFSGDILQITQDGFDADAFTGIGLHIVVDQSQNSGSLILAEDDAGTDLFLLSENGAITVSAAGAETTAITITDTDFTNALSIADNDITGTTFDIIGTDAVINFTDFDVIAEGFMTIAPDSAGDAITINNGDGDIQALVVDATTTDLTSTAGLIDLNVDTSTNLVVGGQYLTLTVIADAGNDSIYGNETSVTINTDADGSDSVYANAIFLNNNDANSTGIGSYISVQSIGGDVGLDILFTQNDDGDATDTSYGELILMTNKSGDAGDKLYGLSITNADDAANQITDALIKLDNAEDTAATVPDGILITSSGVNEGITDAIDVSATNILNSINIGANPIVTGNVAGTIGDSTTDSWTFLTDGTGDGEIVLPDDSIGVAEINDTGDAPGDEECLTYEATGTQFQWETCGGATAFDDIGDPDAATTIAFDDTETVLLQTASDGENFLTIDLTDATLTGTTRGLVIQTADNDDANFVPFTILDDSGGTPDTLFNIGSSGLITTASVDSASLADDDWGDVSITSGVATVQDLTCTDCINATEIEDIYLLNSGDSVTGALIVVDDINLVFGTDSDWLVQYDEGVDDQLIFTTAKTATAAITDPLFEILVDTGIAGMTANQQVFGLGVGSQASNTAIFTVDEDGDVAATSFTGVGTGLTALDGENIQDDTIDDDSIDFADVTGADLTLTDSGAITASGLITANANLDIKNGASAGLLSLFEASGSGTNKATFQVPALAGDTAYILPPDDGDVGEQLQTNGTGTLTWEPAGATAFDDIGDPDAATTIAFDDTETVLLQTASDGESWLTLSGTDTDLAADTTFLLITTADNDDVNYIPFEIQDDSGGTPDTLFRIDSTGKISIGIIDGELIADDTIDDDSIDFADVTGADLTLTDSGAITASGLITANANLDIKNGASAGLLSLFEASGSGTNKATFQVPALAGDTAYILPPDDGDVGEQLQTNGTGTLTWEPAGATAFDDIGDPDAATTIAFDDTETVLLQTASDGENFLTIDLTDATLTGTTRGLVIQTADNDDANFVPFTILDDSGGTPDTLFNIGSSGLITTASVDSASLADDDWGDVSITSGVATVQDLTCTDCINATEIEDIYLLNSGDTSTGDITIAKIDPSLVLTPPGSDTDFWLGVTDDGGNDDDDFFQIGDGSTPGTNPFFTIDTAGNVGIGDPSPDSILNIIGTTTGNGATAVAGILTELTLSNAATDGAFQYGNRSIVTVSSASGVDANYIGQFIRMIDDDCTPTDCINTVRGLEVQAYSGTNNAGINTGIATFGKTFGIQAETTAQAGSVSQAAAVFADLNNSNDGSLGNAIRAFSNDITSANLVFLNQKTSVFTGTALYMNLADGAGTFSGQFADFQKNAVSKFKVDDTGVVSLNLSGTETTNGLCHSGADVDAGTDTLRDVVACSAAPGDIAEWYETESDVEAGDVVMTTANSFAFTEGLFDPFTGMGTGINASRRISILGKAISDNSGSVIGVVSTSPYQTFGDAVRNDQGQNPQPIALSGRVPVKISEENGPIHIGDKLTLSAERAGYAAKMTRSGASIGIALEGSAGDAQGLGMIMVMVNLGYDRIDIALNSEDNSIILDSNLDLSGMALLNVKTINTLADNWSIDENGVLIAREIKTEKLCLGQTCVDESTLKALLQNVGLGNQESSGGGSGTVSGTTSTEPEPTSSESSTDPGSTEPAAPDDDSTAITPTDSVGADATVTDTSTAPTAEETSDTSTAPTTETVSPPAPEPVSTVSSDPVP